MPSKRKGTPETGEWIGPEDPRFAKAYLTQNPSNDALTKYKVGQRVRLAEIEDLPGVREAGQIIAADRKAWGNSYIFEADEEFRDPSDDGLRDITDDDVEAVLP